MRRQKSPLTIPTPSVSNEGIAPNTPAQPTLSIESLTIDQILKNRLVPSLEDEIVALQEADDLQALASQDVAETTRVEDVTDTMLNVADTLDGTEAITPQQAMLTDTVSEMAMAGSDGDPDDVFPSASDVIEGNVTLEAFVDDIRRRAAEIWARIREFCLGIWSSIKEFFKRIFQAAPRLLSQVKSLKELVAEKKKAAAVAAGGNIIPIVGTRSISYPEYMVSNSKELSKGLGELSTLAKYAYGSYLKDCKTMGDKVAGELKKFDPKDAAGAIKTLAADLQKHNFPDYPRNPPTGYLGCFDVVPSRIDKQKAKDLSDAQVMAALRSSGMRLEARHGRASLVNTQNTFQTMSFAEMESTLNQVETMVKQMMAFESSADSRALEKTRQDLIDGGNHAAAEVGKLAGTDEAGRTERAYALDAMKAMMNFNTTLTRWMTELTMPVTKKVYQTTRSALMLVDLSAKQYKAVPAAA